MSEPRVPPSAPHPPGGREPHEYMTSGAVAAALTRLELSMIRAHEAFSDWAIELHKSVGGTEITFVEVTLLNCVRFRGGSTTLAEMMMFLRRNDLAAITYSLRKLEQRAFIRRSKGPFRKEVAYSITAQGMAVTDAYGQARRQLLLGLCDEIAAFQGMANDAAVSLDRLTGIYDRAIQAVLNRSVVAAAVAPPQEPSAD